MASDLIYREDAKVFVRHACYKKINPIDYLDEVPAADVRQVVRGKWIRGNESRTSPTKDSYICSVCGEKTLSGFCGNPAKTNFCPNCGADMREG